MVDLNDDVMAKSRYCKRFSLKLEPNNGETQKEYHQRTEVKICYDE